MTHGGLLFSAARLGLEERAIRIEEAQARLLGDGLRWLMDTLTLRLDLRPDETRGPR